MLSNRMQIQAIADALAGVGGNGRRPQDFQEPWRAAYQAVLDPPPGKTPQEVLREAWAGRRDRDALIVKILSASPGERPTFPSLADIAATLPPIEWLWPDWIPRGMITLLGAVPGAGKSYMALDLTRRIIDGKPFPDGAPQTRPGANVVYVDAELVPQMINERVQRWRMDSSRLHLMMPPPDRMYLDFGDPSDRDTLIEMVACLKPELVVVDSLSSITSKGENSVEDVREVLGFLNRLAKDSQCGLLLVHHLRKRGILPLVDLLTIDDFRGSSHIIAMSRSVIGMSIIQTGPEQDRNGPRRIEIIKTNLARYPEPLGLEFQPLHPTGVRLRYTDEPPAPYKEPSQMEQCAAWLLDVLAAGPMKPKELVEMAKEEGFSRRTLYRARESLAGQVENTEGRQSPANQWRLVGQAHD